MQPMRDLKLDSSYKVKMNVIIWFNEKDGGQLIWELIRGFYIFRQSLLFKLLVYLLKINGLRSGRAGLPTSHSKVGIELHPRTIHYIYRPFLSIHLVQ